MLGRKSIQPAECSAGTFLEADFDILDDFSVPIPDNWKEFNKRYVPK